MRSRATGALLLALSLVAPIELVVTQWADGRRRVERWLETRAPGTTVETYGPLVYQPRFAVASARGVRIARVGPEPVAGRNPQTGMDERRGRIADVVSRAPDVVVLTEGFAAAYLDGGGDRSRVRVVPEVARRERADADDDRGACRGGGDPGRDIGSASLPRRGCRFRWWRGKFT